MANKLVIFKKGEDTSSFTGADDKSAAITGLTAGAVVAAGDYQGALTDGTSFSDKVDVPGFTVLPAVETPPASTETTTPTDDGTTAG
jgi:hypothetical protein